MDQTDLTTERCEYCGEPDARQRVTGDRNAPSICDDCNAEIEDDDRVSDYPKPADCVQFGEDAGLPELHFVHEPTDPSPWDVTHETGELQARRVLRALGFTERESWEYRGLIHDERTWTLTVPQGLATVTVVESTRAVYITTPRVVSWTCSVALCRSVETASNIAAQLDVCGVTR